MANQQDQIEDQKFFPILEKIKYQHRELDAHGLFSETTKNFGIGYCPCKNMSAKIIIPVHTEKGKLAGYAGGDIYDPTAPYVWTDNSIKKREVYNIHRVIESLHPLIQGYLIVADFFDVFHLFHNGYRNVLCLLEKTISDEHYKKLSLLPDRNNFNVCVRERRDGVTIAGQLSEIGFARVIDYPHFIGM